MRAARAEDGRDKVELVLVWRAPVVEDGKMVVGRGAYGMFARED